MDVETYMSKTQEKICPKGVHNIMTSYTNTGNAGSFATFIGSTQLQVRLDGVVGMRVCSMVIRAPAGFTWAGGWEWALQSQTLGSMLARNPFALASSSTADVAPSVQAVPISSIIGVAQIANTTGFADNASAQSTLYELNHYLPFNGSYPIDRFDWAVGPVNGAWTFTGTYTIEFNIEFYHHCCCWSKD